MTHADSSSTALPGEPSAGRPSGARADGVGSHRGAAPDDGRFAAVGRSSAGKQPGTAERLWRELVGEQLRLLRRSRGESLQGASRRASISPQYLSEIERGSKEPSSEILAAVLGALESDLLDLTTRVAGALGSGSSLGAPDRRSVQLAA